MMRMASHRNATEIAAELRHRFGKKEPAIIAIDGFDGSGKTTLARALADDLGGKHLEVDNFLNPEQGAYVEHIRYSDLKGAIADAATYCQFVFVEGVCILKVLARVRITPTALIYTKSVDTDGFWYRGQYLDPQRGPEEVIADLKEKDLTLALLEEGLNGDDSGMYSRTDKGAGPACCPDSLLHEIIRYHFEYEPHKAASFCYEMVMRNV